MHLFVFYRIKDPLADRWNFNRKLIALEDFLGVPVQVGNAHFIVKDDYAQGHLRQDKVNYFSGKLIYVSLPS